MELAIVFREQPPESGAFVFDLIYDGTGHQRDYPFVNPLQEEDLKELRWYLEEYLSWPYSDPVQHRAGKAERKLEEWGEALFSALFRVAPEAHTAYDRLVEASAEERFLTIQSPDPRVLRLPWELLRDNAGPLITSGISVRRHVEQGLTPRVPPFALPLRVLYVIARPTDAGFIDPRSSAGGVMEALAPLLEKGLVTIDFVRPATFEQLSRILDDAPRRYHLLHFDGHGFYDDRRGLGGLAFEDGEHAVHPVLARDLGDLLNRQGIALAVLDACRTGRETEGKEFSSVASQLIQAGVGAVICMSYSVYVEAARLFTQRFYQALVTGRTVGEATLSARKVLLANPVRGRDDSGTRALRDWFLPLLYQRGQDAVAIAPAAAAPAAPPPPARVHGFPPAPRYGFSGRSYELLEVERALLDKRVVALHGFGGVGKTALAREAARWLTRTGLFPGGAAFLSFEQGADEDRAVLALGEMIEGAAFSQRAATERLATVEAYLQEHPTLVVWDNFESLFDDAVTLPAARAEILALGARWAELRGGSRLLITTRRDDVELPEAQKVALGGFAPGDALDYAAAILGQEGIDRAALDKDKLQELMDLLGHHALSLALVLPKLKGMTLAQMLDEFAALLPGFTTGEGKKREESLQVSLEFSLRRLGEGTRALLPALAVFQGGGLETNILAVTQLPEEAWTETMRPELVRAALITVEKIPGVVKPPFIHFHPTLAPHLARLLDPAARAELEARYRQAYYQFAKYIYHADDKTPQQARLLAQRELPNLKRALALTLAAGEGTTAVDFANSIGLFLNAFGRGREREAIMEQVAASAAPSGGGAKPMRAQLILAVQQGQTLRSQGRAQQAEAVIRDLLVRMDADAELGTDSDRVTILIDLGRCLRDQGKRSDALDLYRKSLALIGELEQTDEVKRKNGLIHTDLAGVLTDLAQYDEAREHYETSLAIKEALTGEERGKAVVLSELGNLALAQGELAEARRRWTETLAAFRALGEPRSEAICLHQLGLVAQEERDWEEAERCYKESLAIEERLGDKALAATTCNQLALVAESAGRPEEAERWYVRAIEGFEQIGQTHYIAVAASNLADLLLAQNRLDEAEQYAHRAREIKETLDLSSEPWKTYNILAEIADARGPGHEAEAQAWRRKAEEAQRAFAVQSGGQWSPDGARIAQQVHQWDAEIEAVVAACQGNQQTAQALEPTLQKYAQSKDWGQLVAVLRRILAGERGAALAAGLDKVDVAIVGKILAQLG